MRASVLILLVSGCLYVVLGEDAKNGTSECHQKVKQVLKKIIQGNTACQREMESHKKTKEEFLAQQGCLAKCALKKANILHDDTHLVTEETVKAAIIENIHPDFQEKGTASVIKCLHDHKADQMDPKDAKCTGYDDLKQCIQDNTSEMCGEAPIF